MTTSDNERDYEVGYGKPPKHSRFKKGRSGNPKGRPKAAKNLATLLKERLHSKIPIMEHGRRKEIPAVDALFRKLIKSALEGDPRAQDRLIRLFPMVEANSLTGDEGTDPPEIDESDEAILRHFFEANGPALRDMSGPDQAEDEET